MTQNEWIELCSKQYLRMGVKNENKAREWAKSTFFRLGKDLSQCPKEAAEYDLFSWDDSGA